MLFVDCASRGRAQDRFSPYSERILMGPWRLCIKAVWVLYFLSSFPSMAFAEAKDSHWIREQVSQGWEKAKSFSKSIQVDFTTKEIDREKNGEVSQNGQGRIRSREGCFLSLYEQITATKPHPFIGRINYSYVEGVNTKYAFDLIKKLKEDKWSIKQYKLHPLPNDKFALAGEKQEDSILFSHFSAKLMISAIFKENKCNIASVRQDQNSKYYQVHFQYGHQNEHRYEGWVLLDSSAMWCVKEFELSRIDPASIVDGYKFQFVGNHTYQIGKDGFPYPENLVFQTTGFQKGKKIYDVEETYSLKCYQDDAVPEYEFSLSAFGFAEPAGIRISKPRPYYWFLLIGMGCLAIAILIPWVLRKRKPAPPILSESDGKV